jgi:RNA polymerase sigma-70 factor (ECF subfamily)
MKDEHTRSEKAKIELFTQLLATCQRKVFLYALGLLHNAADAEEVLQETNVVLWQKFHEYQQGTDFSRWACRVAYYEILKLRERKARHERVFGTEFIETLAAESERTMDELDVRRDALNQCLGKLSQNDRDLVRRRYQAGATTRSVAKMLGRSVQGTRKSLHRIRTRLLGCIQKTLALREHP